MRPINAASAARHQARILRGYAKLMSDAGQHAVAAELMRRALATIRG